MFPSGMVETPRLASDGSLIRIIGWPHGFCQGKNLSAKFGIALSPGRIFPDIEGNVASRIYDDLIGTFTRNGTVDEETQRNDLAIIRQVAGVTESIPNARAYDFSFALEADRQLNQAGWRP